MTERAYFHAKGSCFFSGARTAAMSEAEVLISSLFLFFIIIIIIITTFILFNGPDPERKTQRKKIQEISNPFFDPC